MRGGSIASTDHDFPTTPGAAALVAKHLTIVRPAPAHVGRLPRKFAEDCSVSPSPFAIELGRIPGLAQKPLFADLAELIAGRLLIQGSSGAGKSATLRRIIEQASHLACIHIVDPEGEFGNLARHIGAVTVEASPLSCRALGDIAADSRKHLIPVHLDLSDMGPDLRIEKAAAYFEGLIDVPRDDWDKSILVCIDEAHVLAPHVAGRARDAEIRRVGTSTLTDMVSRGRKRGIGTVIATQRLAKLATSVVAELHNFLIGKNVLDLDIQRAAGILGYNLDKADLLRDLRPGHFVALGPALSANPEPVHIGPSLTRHSSATPAPSPSASISVEEKSELLAIETRLAETEGAGADDRPERGKLKALDAFLSSPVAFNAVSIVRALSAIVPAATTQAELTSHLNADGHDIEMALDMLTRVGWADTLGRGESRKVRLPVRVRPFMTSASQIAQVKPPTPPEPARALADIHEDDLAEARRRMEIIRPILDSGRGKKENVKRVAKEFGVGEATLYRWLRMYKANGKIADLAPQTRKKAKHSKLRSDVETVVLSTIKELRSKTQKIKTAHIINVATERCLAAGLKPPHANSIRKRIKESRQGGIL